MTNKEAIELLRNAVPAKALPDDEIGFFIEAVSMAIAALEGKDIDVPTNSASDHIHNVVRDDAYRRGYEQGKADANRPEIPDSWIPVTERMPEDAEDVPAIPLDWIRAYINNLKAMGVQLSLRDAQAVSVMVDKYMMEQNGNATCGPDYCEIGGTHDE